MSEAVNASLLAVAVFVREIGQVSKREHIFRIFPATCVLAPWLGKQAQSIPVL